jgi:hypothetical protein
MLHGFLAVLHTLHILVVAAWPLALPSIFLMAGHTQYLMRHGKFLTGHNAVTLISLAGVFWLTSDVGHFLYRLISSGHWISGGILTAASISWLCFVSWRFGAWPGSRR